MPEGSGKHTGAPTNPTTPSVWEMVDQGGPPTSSSFGSQSLPFSSHRGGQRSVAPTGKHRGVEEDVRGLLQVEE